MNNKIASNDFYFNNATHYSGVYPDPQGIGNVHGNVNVLAQEYTDLARLDNTTTGHYQRYKKAEYSYDLVSGNVNEVAYQKGQNDEFRHRYSYDADNRVTSVYTSRNGHTWDQDAKYDFYLHGPLARTEIGDRKVQGMDFFYTIQGQIKGVNAANLDRNNDLGNDGSSLAWNTTMQNQHRNVGADAFGFVLQYFSSYVDQSSNTHSDYSAVHGDGDAALADMVNLDDPARDLFNGNIKAMAVALSQPNTSALPTAMPLMMNRYKYDQLNRILQHDAFTGTSTSAYGSLTNTNEYKNTFTYDANGNILNQFRNGNGNTAAQAMDNLTYNYQSGTNKLTSVNDAVGGAQSANYEDDLENQTANNYTYDQIGNLVSVS
jgi:hypothetical protein